MIKGFTNSVRSEEEWSHSGLPERKKKVFQRKTSSETGKEEQCLLWSLQMRKDQGKCKEKRER